MTDTLQERAHHEAIGIRRGAIAPEEIDTSLLIELATALEAKEIEAANWNTLAQKAEEARQTAEAECERLRAELGQTEPSRDSLAKRLADIRRKPEHELTDDDRAEKRQIYVALYGTAPREGR